MRPNEPPPQQQTSGEKKHPSAKQLQAYVSGGGNEQLRGVIKDHLLECSICFQVAQQLGNANTEAAQQSVASVAAIAKKPRPTRRERPAKKQKSKFWAVAGAILPFFGLLIVLFFFRDTLLQRFTGKPVGNGKIVLEDMPLDVRVLIDGRPAKFERPTAGKPAEIEAEPGNYQLTIMRGQKLLKTQRISVEPARELRLSLKEQKVSSQPRSLPKVNPPVRQPAQLASNTPNKTDDGKANSTDDRTPLDLGNTTAQPAQKPQAPDMRNVDRRFTDLQLSTALRNARMHLLNRRPELAVNFMRPYFVSPDDHQLPDDHPLFQEFVALQRCTAALTSFIRELEAARLSKSAGDSFVVNGKRVSVVDSNRLMLSIRSEGTNMTFSSNNIPNLIEQALINERFIRNRPDDEMLVKAMGLISHRKLTQKGKELALTWLKEVLGLSEIQQRHISDLIRSKDTNELDNVNGIPGIAGAPNFQGVPGMQFQPELEGLEEDPDATFELSRKLGGAMNSIAKLFFLPKNMTGEPCLISSEGQLQGFSYHSTHIWSLRTGIELAENDPSGPMWRMQSSRNGRILATLTTPRGPGSVRIFTPPSTRVFKQYRVELDERAALQLSSDGRKLAVCTADESFALWNLRTGKTEKEMAARAPLGEEQVDCLTISPNFERVVIGDTLGGLHVWKTDDGEIIELSPELEGGERVIGLSFDTSGKHVVVVRKDGTMELCRSADLKPELKIETGSPITRVNFSANRKLIVTVNEKNHVSLRDLDTLKELEHFSDTHPRKVTAVAVDDSANWIAVGFEDADVHLWKAK